MRKVIVKAKLSSRDRFEEKLSDIDLDFSPIYWQHDRIYVPRDYKKNSNYPRLIMRTEMISVDKPARYTLILRRHIEDSGIDIIEETAIKDYENTVNIILQLGFKPFSEVSRRRQDLKTGEGTVIYLDKVENLSGYYAKIESEITPEDSVIEARQDLEKTFQTLGESNFVNKPYSEI
ncbi:MAG: CYTH domain-containing protein [Candidatus Saccharibacteria bacterium]|nr:CYTH domain-containing protein [Candidatus Saccharibacteria bacterium]